MSARRTICVVTGTRAEYGLLRPLMALLDEDPAIDFQLVVTGAHLSSQHGSTIRFIEHDGFRPAVTVDISVGDDTPLGVAHVLARATSALADALAKLAPDILVLLGDRYEILAAAQAALILGIPVAHIHGGEVTTGAFDDSIRHAVTKMSNLHFVAAEDYRRRVIQLGESPDTVFNVGALGLDVLSNNVRMTREDIAATVGIELRSPLFLVTHHPTTRSTLDVTSELNELLGALEHFASASIIFTGANADPGYTQVNDQIRRFVARAPRHRVFHDSLGQHAYLNLMRIADVVVGNSSSGIIEAPAVHVPTVNIGQRQTGRLRADSIIDVNVAQSEIRTAIETALSQTWKAKAVAASSMYGTGNTAKQIADTLKTAKLTTHKAFFDIWA